MDLVQAVWTDHARQQAAWRGVEVAEVEAVLRRPERVELVREGRVVVQSVVGKAERRHLLRVVVDVDRTPPEIVTTYRTSKMGKYTEDRA